MSDKKYIYGENNGGSYQELIEKDSMHGTLQSRTHWDPRVEVQAIAGTVQVGIVPPSSNSDDERGQWNPADGQFLTLSRDGVNRLIRALREARTAVHGEDA